MSEWVQFFIVMGTILTFLVKSRMDHKESQKDLKEFREKWAEEAKDFHGRLERQDAEFKAFMKTEEQKRTQILMGK